MHYLHNVHFKYKYGEANFWDHPVVKNDRRFCLWSRVTVIDCCARWWRTFRRG